MEQHPQSVNSCLETFESAVGVTFLSRFWADNEFHFVDSRSHLSLISSVNFKVVDE